MAATAAIHAFSTRSHAPIPLHSISLVNTTQCNKLCNQCNLREVCLPAGLGQDDLKQLDCIVRQKRTLRRGQYLYRAGAPLQSLYAVRIGFLKSCVLHEDGREQAAGFHMMGDLLGLDAIGSSKHVCDVVALEDCEICEVSFSDLEQLSRTIPALQQHIHRVMSREITRDYGVMLLLGSMRAEERLATFLLNLSQRFAARGYSGTRFVLRMTREEIGSYLGLKLETVSRAFSHFQSEGLIAVRNRDIELKNPKSLRQLVGQGSRC